MTASRLRQLGARRARSTAGQATVELVLALPIVCMLLVALLQIALVARDQIRVVHAAREAVREAAVGADGDRVDAAAQRVLEGARIDVRPGARIGDPVTVRVDYRAETDLPLIGAIFPDVDLTAEASMRRER